MELPEDAQRRQNTDEDPGDYLTTRDVAKLCRRSVPWVLRQKDLPYRPGRPNLYSRRDLDAWFERTKRNPLV